MPVAGKYELPGTGLTITFAAASEDAESSFQVGDTWSFSTTAPAMTKGDALAAHSGSGAVASGSSDVFIGG